MAESWIQVNEKSFQVTCPPGKHYIAFAQFFEWFYNTWQNKPGAIDTPDFFAWVERFEVVKGIGSVENAIADNQEDFEALLEVIKETLTIPKYSDLTRFPRFTRDKKGKVVHEKEYPIAKTWYVPTTTEGELLADILFSFPPEVAYQIWSTVPLDAALAASNTMSQRRYIADPEVAHWIETKGDRERNAEILRYAVTTPGAMKDITGRSRYANMNFEDLTYFETFYRKYDEYQKAQESAKKKTEGEE